MTIYAEGRKIGMFDSTLLKLYRTDGVVKSYLYGAAVISAAQDDERIYVSIDRPFTGK